MPHSPALRRGGHLQGGPLYFALALLFAGCAGGRPARPTPTERLGFARPLETFHAMGMLAGPAQFPVVASFATLAGPGDSTYVVVAMSLPNSALRFQRDPRGFVGEYTVSISFLEDSLRVKRINHREQVRIPTFAETGRTDESVVFQDEVALEPGRYEVRFQAGDANSARGFRAVDTLEVPAYGDRGRRLSSPVLVYQTTGREQRSDVPGFIVNPRHSVPYGGDAPHLYIESYGGGDTTHVRITDTEGNEVWSARAVLQNGSDSLRYGQVELPAGTLPLGRLWVEVASADPGTPMAKTPLVMSISDQWMVANFDEVLQFLRYIATPEELDSLAEGNPVERRQRWEAFWAKRDPLPATPINEYREDFFQRVRYATENFGEAGGRPGWQTDRGEVYIVLGPPDHAVERYIDRTQGSGRPNAIEWIYEAAPGGRLELLFLDQNGFGRYELAPSSRSAFRSTAARIKPRDTKR